MEKQKIEKCVSLSVERDDLDSTIKNYQQDHFVIGHMVINQSSPLHSRILAILTERLGEVEKQLEDL